MSDELKLQELQETEDDSNTPSSSSSSSSPPSSPQITLRVVGQDGHEVNYKMKVSTSLGKVMQEYAQRIGVSKADLRFLFDGRRIANDETPKILEMQEMDVIEVFLHQTGGNGNGISMIPLFTFI